jgi:hypothetical protein
MSATVDKSFLVKTFNDHFFEFFEDVLKILPDNIQIKTALRSFRTVADLNKSILVKCWHKFVYTKYSSVIDAGDISFFFEKDYSNDVNHLNNSHKIMEIIDTVRQPVKDACENTVNKQHVITYIQNLSKLSVCYSE